MSLLVELVEWDPVLLHNISHRVEYIYIYFACSSHIQYICHSNVYTLHILILSNVYILYIHCIYEVYTRYMLGIYQAVYTMYIYCIEIVYHNLHCIYPVYTVYIQGIFHVYVDFLHIPLIYLV
jgi:hypothetical protein